MWVVFDICHGSSARRLDSGSFQNRAVEELMTV